MVAVYSMRDLLVISCLFLTVVLLPWESNAAPLFQEGFEDSNLAARGWYDNTTVKLSTVEHIPGSTSSIEYHFLLGAMTPEISGGTIRRKFADTDSVYIGYYVKHSGNWVGSGRAYHPHEFFLLTNLDSDYWGPSVSHLTAYVEENGGYPVMLIQDTMNIDQSRIGQDLTNITELRATGGCNGSLNDGYALLDCYGTAGNYRNEKKWTTTTQYFRDTAGPYYKGDWHRVEAYFKLNSIANNRGVADGVLQYWYDGVLIINHANVIFRTGQYPTMRFNKLLIAPYIGDGSPVDQTMWIDELTVATTRPTSSAPNPPANLNVN